MVESVGRKATKGSRSSSISSEKSSKSGASSSTNQSAAILDPLSSALIDGSDPLSKIASEQMDPLSKMAAQMSIATTNKEQKNPLVWMDYIFIEMIMIEMA